VLDSLPLETPLKIHFIRKNLINVQLVDFMKLLVPHDPPQLFQLTPLMIDKNKRVRQEGKIGTNPRIIIISSSLNNVSQPLHGIPPHTQPLLGMSGTPHQADQKGIISILTMTQSPVVTKKLRSLQNISNLGAGVKLILIKVGLSSQLPPSHQRLH
jgi:hypothetical protein